MKNAVHEVVAKLLAWSIKIGSSGVFPSSGFHGEEFPQNSWRYKRRGKEFSTPWRTVEICQLMFMFFCNGVLVDQCDMS